MKITERHLKNRVIEINRVLKTLGTPVGLRVDRNSVKGYSVDQVFRKGGHVEGGIAGVSAVEASAYIEGYLKASQMFQMDNYVE